MSIMVLLEIVEYVLVIRVVSLPTIDYKYIFYNKIHVRIIVYYIYHIPQYTCNLIFLYLLLAYNYY